MLLKNVRAVDVRAGDCFFRENDQADSMFVLEAGRVAVIKGWRGHDFVLHGLRRWRLFRRNGVDGHASPQRFGSCRGRVQCN